MNPLDLARLSVLPDAASRSAMAPEIKTEPEALQAFQLLLVETLTRSWIGDAFKGAGDAQSGFAADLFSRHLAQMIAKTGALLPFPDPQAGSGAKGPARDALANLERRLSPAMLPVVPSSKALPAAEPMTRPGPPAPPLDIGAARLADSALAPVAAALGDRSPVVGAVNPLTVEAAYAAGAALGQALPKAPPAVLPEALRPEAGPLSGVVPGSPTTPRISSGFGLRADPISGRTKMHRGVDIPLPAGTTVRAVDGGRVTYAGRGTGPMAGYGNVVEIDHGNGRRTRYAHLQSVSVRPGEQVEAGTALARSGSSGRSTGPHLHFELRSNGVPVAPPPEMVRKVR